MKYRKLDKTRCPWCGEVFERTREYYMKRSPLDYPSFRRWKRFICSKCGRETKEFPWIIIKDIILCIFAMYLGVKLSQYEGNAPVEELVILLVLAISVMSPTFLREDIIPYFRICILREEEQILGRASIQWYPYKQGGIGFAHARLLNNMIFPVCFLDEKGNPVSQTLCIRFKKGLGFLWNYAKITLISDHLWNPDKNGKTPWEKAEKFVIFNNGEIVGEGKLWKEKGNTEKNI